MLKHLITENTNEKKNTTNKKVKSHPANKRNVTNTIDSIVSYDVTNKKKFMTSS